MPAEAHRHGHPGESPECLICPVCVLLQALTASRPDVMQHLIAAGRELTLALKAALDDHVDAHTDAHTDAHPGAGERLRRINID